MAITVEFTGEWLSSEEYGGAIVGRVQLKAEELIILRGQEKRKASCLWSKFLLSNSTDCLIRITGSPKT